MDAPLPKPESLKKYEITLDVYKSMLEAQGGVCAICQRGQGNRPLSVDHSHTTGQVRGLLCVGCNNKVGAFESFRQHAERYLRRFDVTWITDDSALEADLDG